MSHLKVVDLNRGPGHLTIRRSLSAGESWEEPVSTAALPTTAVIGLAIFEIANRTPAQATLYEGRLANEFVPSGHNGLELVNQRARSR